MERLTAYQLGFVTVDQQLMSLVAGSANCWRSFFVRVSGNLERLKKKVSAAAERASTTVEEYSSFMASKQQAPLCPTTGNGPKVTKAIMMTGHLPLAPTTAPYSTCPRHLEPAPANMAGCQAGDIGWNRTFAECPARHPYQL